MSLVYFADFVFLTFPAQQPDSHIPWPVLDNVSDVRHRPGADGSDVQLLGRKGFPFPAFSFVDCEDLDDAQLMFWNYKQRQGDGVPYDLNWYGTSYRDYHDVLYLILKVEVLVMRRVFAAVGGVSANKGAVLRCKWDLLPVSATADALPDIGG